MILELQLRLPVPPSLAWGLMPISLLERCGCRLVSFRDLNMVTPFIAFLAVVFSGQGHALAHLTCHQSPPEVANGRSAWRTFETLSEWVRKDSTWFPMRNCERRLVGDPGLFRAAGCGRKGGRGGGFERYSEHLSHEL